MNLRKRRFGSGWLAAVALCCGLSALGQQPAQAASDKPEGVSITTLKVAVRRVVVDVVVTDAKGKPVPGLLESDFHVVEDGKPQPVRSFEVHTAEIQAPVTMPKLPVNTFANLSGSQSGPISVILYDLLNTPLDAQPYAHAQLLKFLRQRKTSGQVAIFVLSDRLHMLQGFTDDENQLIAALNRQKGKLYKSTNLQSAEEASQASSALSQTDGNANGSTSDPDTAFQTVTAMLQHMETAEASYLLDRRVEITAQALEEIARFLVGMRGRKSLLWLSGSFPTGIVPNGDLQGRDSFDVVRNYSNEIKQATDLLNVSHVAVYPVDVRGLQVNPMFSAAGRPAFEPGQGKDSQAVRNFTQSQAAEHSTMDTIGNETGGRAFYNTNGLTEAAATAMQEGALYYTLTYAPADGKYDGKLRRVRVELARPGYHLAYRRSYFADDAEAIARQEEDNPSDPLSVPLQHGAPAAHELFFEAHLQPNGTPVPATPEELTALAQYEAVTAHRKRRKTAAVAAAQPVAMQHYVITYGLLARQLQLPVGPDGNRRDNLEFGVMAYNDDGERLNGIRTKVRDVITPDRYAKLRDEGYQILQQINVPVTAASIRLAVRDTLDNRVGSLEVRLPLAKIAALPASQPLN